MKKITIVLFVLIGCMGWVACKKTKNSTTPDPVITRGMSAKINGVLWTADTNTMSYFSFGNYLEITGYDTSGRTIDLRINAFKNRGTFIVPQANDSIFYATDYGVLATPSVASSGSISVQAVNDTAVGGTFSFTAGGITVTEGTFNWNYQ